MLALAGGYGNFLWLVGRLFVRPGLLTHARQLHLATMTVEQPDACPADAEGPPYDTPAALEKHIQRSWAHFRSLGSPKFHVAPMVDQVGSYEPLAPFLLAHLGYVFHPGAWSRTVTNPMHSSRRTAC
jgi:hypothetical protein